MEGLQDTMCWCECTAAAAEWGWYQCLSVMKPSPVMSREELHEPALQGIICQGLAADENGFSVTADLVLI